LATFVTTATALYQKFLFYLTSDDPQSYVVLCGFATPSGMFNLIIGEYDPAKKQDVVIEKKAHSAATTAAAFS